MKKFWGKIIKKNKSGTITYQYDKEDKNNVIVPSKYEEEIINHFNKIFPNREYIELHKKESEMVDVSVHILYPNEKEPYYVLYTTGMSSLPMTIPEQVPKKMKKGLQYAEVMMFLPGTWEFPIIELLGENENNYYFPIKLLEYLAEFPHVLHTWLGYGHTVASDEHYTPYANNTELSAVFLYQLQEDISEIKIKDDMINFYFVVPIYKEEVEYKLEHGTDALLNKLSIVEEELLFLNPKRINTCAKK